jgi:alpha-tubulin suppressor-like RCC1 family protein
MNSGRTRATSGGAARRRGPQAFVWGYNNTGGLGLGHTARVHGPTPVRLPRGVVDVQGGADFTVALTEAGEVWTWGGNAHGELGDGTTTTRRIPARIRLPRRTRVTEIAVGTDHVLALTRRGDVLAWGRNHRGQVGTGTTESQLRPERVRGLHGRVTALGAGDAVSAVVTADGAVTSWGRNGSGQLAVTADRHGHDLLEPVRARLPRGTEAVAVDAGRRHLVVLTRNGTLLNYGVDARGKQAPVRVALSPAWGRVRSISAGDDHTLAVTSRGYLLAWGANSSGQLGTGRAGDRLAPVRVTLPRARGRVVRVLAGARHGVAVTSASEVYTWGEGNLGQVGLGRDAAQGAAVHTTPRRITELDGAVVSGLHGGAHHTVLTVRRGPAVGLRLEPGTSTVRADHPLRYRVHRVDTFGNDLGPVPAGTPVTLTVTDGHVSGSTVRARSVGPHTVTARAGSLGGRAILHVQKGR